VLNKRAASDLVEDLENHVQAVRHAEATASKRRSDQTHTRLLCVLLMRENCFDIRLRVTRAALPSRWRTLYSKSALVGEQSTALIAVLQS
jgi:hypothetical protein